MKFTIHDMGMGMIQAVNDDIALIGGMRSGNSSADVTRLRYVIYDMTMYAEMSKANKSEQDIDKACQVGNVDLFVTDGTQFDVKGLVNIEIDKDKRKNGYASKVIKSILNTTENELNIHDIKKQYVSTWRKLGVEEFTNGNGRVVQASKYSGFLHGVIPAQTLEIELNAQNLDSEMSM